MVASISLKDFYEGMLAIASANNVASSSINATTTAFAMENSDGNRNFSVSASTLFLTASSIFKFGSAPGFSAGFSFPETTPASTPITVSTVVAAATHSPHNLDKQGASCIFFQQGVCLKVTDDHVIRNEKDTDEYLREFSPGFDVLVDDEMGDYDYYHDEDQF
ncbi:hypothetical protein D5086_023024 [Populus alba]|uniref:Uncharacterized protein n=1 Tax=Populus alba TaxID=43335 RepID=A0ACC4BAF0_POPAL